VAIKADQGVLAFGDSITNGGGELQWGVALQSWALWLARALGMPFTSHAVDGARTVDVPSRQIADHRRLNAIPEPGYQVGCLYIGTNDVRALDWDPVAYERDLAAGFRYLVERCERTLTATIPLDVGRPRVGAKVREANAVIERQAADAGVLVIDLRGFAGRRILMHDHVHPTAMGQIEIAERALDVLAADGLPARIRPSEIATPQYPLPARVRALAAYAYRSGKQAARIRLTAATRSALRRP
jgi:lysophospholipase L1-like esterase